MESALVGTCTMPTAARMQGGLACCTAPAPAMQWVVFPRALLANAAGAAPCPPLAAARAHRPRALVLLPARWRAACCAALSAALTTCPPQTSASTYWLQA